MLFSRDSRVLRYKDKNKFEIIKEILLFLFPDFITFCCNIMALIDFQAITVIYWVVLGGANLCFISRILEF